MLLDFTRKTYTQTAILLCFTLLLLWCRQLSGVPVSEVTNEPLMPLAALLQEGMLAIGNTLSMVLAMAFTLCLAYLLMYIMQKQDLLRRQDHLVAFIFILLSCSLPTQQLLGGAQIAALLCLIALDKHLNLYHAQNTAKHIFTAAFAVGIASLFYPPALLFFFVILVGTAFLKVYNWRDFFICIFGLLTPLALGLIYYHITGENMDKPLSVMVSYFTPDKPLFLSLDHFNEGYICIGFIGLLCLIAAFTNARGILSNIRVSKMFGTLRLSFFVILIGSFIFPAMFTGSMLILLAIPASILLVNYLSGIRKAKWANLLLLLFIASCFLLQLFF